MLFNPAAENVIASASGDFTIKIWDIEAGSPQLTLKVGDVIQSLSWSANGSLLVTTSRDKKLRIWDARQEKAVHEVPGHAGAKNSRAVWMGEHDRVATTGFSRMSDRQLALWDIKSPGQPVGGFQMLDSISGVCMPFWDDGTQCLYLAGKGDGNIRYYEYEHDKFEYLSEYKSGDPQRGVAFLPKRGVNMHENEVMRAYKTVNDTYIEPISFIVPRRAETFQEDIYPPTTGLKPAMSSHEWFDGAEGLPPKVSMESLYDGAGLKEVPAGDVHHTAKKAPEPIQVPEIKKEVEQAMVREPTMPAAARPPPPDIKEQGQSMMAAASKFQDQETADEESSDESSFEEVLKPADRTSAIKLTLWEKKEAPPSAAPSASALWESAERPEQPTAADTAASQVRSQNKIKMGQPSANDRYQIEDAALSGASAPVSEPAVERGGIAATPTSTGTEALEREIQNIKAMMAQQSQQLTGLSTTVMELVAELKALKSS